MDELNDLDGPETSSEMLKVEYAPVMQAIYRSMRRFAQPGINRGVAEVADLIDRPANTLRHQFGPTCYDHAPTAYGLLQVIEALASREAVAEIAALADCTTIPRRVRAKDVGAPPEDAAAFAQFGELVVQRLAPTVRRLEAKGRLSVAERTQARDALFDIAAYAAHLASRVR